LKVGQRDYTVSTNSSPALVADINDLAVKYLNGAMVYMRDIGLVRDGYVVQQNTVRADSQPSVLLTIMKTGSVSTLDIIDEIKQRILPVTRAAAPPGMNIRELFDQSVFVRASIQGVLREQAGSPLPTFSQAVRESPAGLGTEREKLEVGASASFYLIEVSARPRSRSIRRGF
jgi:multidrug efflux pump subunit AcrB